jgi:TonB family protein
MLQTLLYSQPARTKWFSTTAFSAITHGALIAAAIGSTGLPQRYASEHSAGPPTRVTYVTPAMLLAALHSARHGTGAPAAGKARPLVLPNVEQTQRAIEDLTLVTTLAEPDLPDLTLAVGSADDTLPIGAKSVRDAAGLGPIAPAPINGAYAESAVDRAIIPRRGNPAPRYPSALQSIGVEGTFMVEFVVDSTGKVDPDHIEFPREMHRLFVESVRNALLRSRFFPAQIAGRFVSQHAIQEFKFTMSKDGR